MYWRRGVCNMPFLQYFHSKRCCLGKWQFVDFRQVVPLVDEHE